MSFSKYLTPEERIEAWKSGITFKLAEKEVLPSEFNAMCKKAQEDGGIPIPLKAMLLAALFIGGPIGIGAHMLDDEIHKGTAKINDKRRTREYYRDIAQRLKDELSTQEGGSYEPTV